MIVFIEVITFGAALGVFVFTGRDNVELFQQSRALLNQPLAFINTLILLSGGWCMVNGLDALKQGKPRAAYYWVGGAGLTGIVFAVLKAVEYAAKFGHGIGFGEDEFFTLYFLLTGFHLAHVLVAVILLCAIMRGIKIGKYTAGQHFDVESSGIFWHMCDLIWLLVYPIIYLL